MTTSFWRLFIASAVIPIVFGLYYLFWLSKVRAGFLPTVVISEIAWSGTKASSNDEWLELFNATDAAINLEGWGLYKKGGEVLIIALKGEIAPQGFYLIERTDDSVVSDITADLVGPFGGGGLNNGGEHLVLKNAAGLIVDELNFSSSWPAGTAGPDYKTMERIDVLGQGSDSNNWLTHSAINSNGLDSKGNVMLGTPKRVANIISSTSTSQEQATTTGISNTSSINVDTAQSQSGGKASSLNKQPTINLPDNVYLLAGERLDLDTSQIKDPENEPLVFHWNFGDGAVSKDAKPTHIYLYPGHYTITLSVKDSVNESKASLIANVYPKNIFINEFVANPVGKDDSAEWLELYNHNDFAVNISGYILETASDKFVIPEDTLLFKKSFLVLSSSNTRLNLKNDKGSIKLLTPERILLQEINYEGLKEGVSVARKNDDYYFSQILTPGIANIIYFKSDKVSAQNQRVAGGNTASLTTKPKANSLNLIAGTRLGVLKYISQTQYLPKNKFLYAARVPEATDFDDLSLIKRALAARFKDNSLLASAYNQDIARPFKSDFSQKASNIIALILFAIGSAIISYLFIYRRADYIKLFKDFR